MVRDGQVMWRDADPAVEGNPVLRRSAGFAHSTRGSWFAPEVLVALWELRRSELLVVDGGVVLLTKQGRVRLSEWDATRAGAR